MSTQEYLKTLAYELRQRKQDEQMVRSTLQEVQSHLAMSGETGEAAFGDAADYAASFPTGATLSRGKAVGNMAAGVLIAMLVASWCSGEL